MFTTTLNRAGLLAAAAVCLLMAGPAALAAKDAGATALAPTTQRIAILPVENLSGVQLPPGGLRGDVTTAVESRGIAVAQPQAVDDVLAALRVRYVGGVNDATGAALHQHAGVDAVLVTSVVIYDPGDPPRIGIEARLVTIGRDAVHVAWATSVHIAGNDTPGLLDLKLVHDPAVLTARAIDQVARELEDFLRGAHGRPSGVQVPKSAGRFRPSSLFVAKDAPAFGRDVHRVAVLPFINDTGRRAGGEIVGLQFVRELTSMGGVEVIEPGRVRNVLLDMRVIQEGGLTIAQADMLRVLLDVDLVITGSISEFRDGVSGGSAPMAEITAYGMDTRRGQVAWLARNYTTGHKGVVLFDLGEIKNAGRLMSEMTRGIVAAVVRRSGRS